MEWQELGCAHLRALEVKKTRPLALLVEEHRASARVEEGRRAAVPRGAPICPLIGSCGRVGSTWLAELEFRLFL